MTFANFIAWMGIVVVLPLLFFFVVDKWGAK